MPRHPAFAALCVVVVLALGRGQAAALPQEPADGVARLLARLQQVMAAGKPEAYLDMLSAVADRPSAQRAAQALIAPSITRAVVKERDRMPLEGTLPGNGFRLMVEVFTEYGDRARVATWRVDVRRVSGADDGDEWAIAGQDAITTIDGLYRLSLNRVRQYRVRNLAMTAEDLEVRLADGRLFVADTQEGTTAVVLLAGSGAVVRFAPAPEVEREQVRLFAGEDVIEDEFQDAFVRVNPGEFAERFPSTALQIEPVDGGALRRAEAVFREFVGKSFGLDLGDLSREGWSLAPTYGDLLVEVRTRRFQTLTYTRSGGEAEDITVFDRRRRRNISVYASKANAERYGRFFDEDVSASFDITSYRVEASFIPERQMIDGQAQLRLRLREPSSNLTFKLADSLTVRSVFSLEYGRLPFLRVRNQNSVVVNLPGTVMKDMPLTFVFEYGGPLPPAQIDREAVAAGQDPFITDVIGLQGEASLLYTTRSWWYPQSDVSDYAPAFMELTVPDIYTVVASGDPQSGSPAAVEPEPGQKGGRRRYTFATSQPVRYLSCLISKMVRVDARQVVLTEVLTAAAPDGTQQPLRPVRPGVFYDGLSLTVDANARLRTRARQLAPVAEDIVRFYAGLVGDVPYPTLAVGLIEKDLPGGHSPAYVSVIHQPQPNVAFTWANDPAAFQNYPEFFIAHEIAHQWWGQAVGWRSYHEQWVSEGFSQYFAALYAQRRRGDQAFQDVLQRMARFAREHSSQGPVSLGYRLGHIKGDMRVFRSLVYNKSALVLHQLRLLLGDETFFRGMRRFYFDWRFKKASSLDVQRAFEAESGQDLSAFFGNWLHTSGVPVVKFSWTRDTAGAEPAAVVALEQVGTVFELPVILTLRFADNSTKDVQVPLRARTAEARIPLTGDLRDIVVNAAGTGILDVYRN
jgi:hypothetical protein